MDKDGRLKTDGQSLELSKAARAELARRAGMPTSFFESCPPDIQWVLFN